MEITNIFDDIEETRSTINQKYPVAEIAFLVLASFVCGYNNWHAIARFGDANLDWLRKFFPYANGTPTRHNIARIIRMIKPESLNELLVNWARNYQFEMLEMQRQPADKKASDGDSPEKSMVNLRKVIAIDGKDVRGLQAHTGEVLNVVSVYDVGLGITMSTEMGLGKGQEIEMVRNVLNTLNLKECVITLDALHCQSDTINTIVKQKATALIQVKANQGKLYDSIDAQFQSLWAQPESKQGVAEEDDKTHGRKELRSAYALPIELNEKLLKKWPHLKTAIAIVRDRQVKGKIGTYATSYYVCTTEMTAEEALKIVRLHWGIENQLHWILDVTLKEDQSAVHDRIAAKNLASFRRMTLNLLRITPLLEKKKEAPMTAKMMKSVFDINFRESVIFNLARG